MESSTTWMEFATWVIWPQWTEAGQTTQLALSGDSQVIKLFNAKTHFFIIIQPTLESMILRFFVSIIFFSFGTIKIFCFIWLYKLFCNYYNTVCRKNSISYFVTIIICRKNFNFFMEIQDVKFPMSILLLVILTVLCIFSRVGTIP